MTRYNIGSKYTRTEIRKIEEDPGTMGKWVSGYVEHKGEIFIFSTFGGESYTGVDHGDEWIDETERVFNWNAKKNSDITDKHIKMMLDSNHNVHMFTRKSNTDKTKLKGAPFVYQGIALPLKVSGKNPVNIVWKLNGQVTPFIELDDYKNGNEIIELEKMDFSAEDIAKSNEKELIKRSQKLKNHVLKRNGYTCEINPSHKTFVSNRTKKNYMETHHIVPLSAQCFYKCKLDSVANISCLCPNCHRIIHYGTWHEKKPLLKKLYNQHIEDLKKSKIEVVSFDEILIYYKY